MDLSFQENRTVWLKGEEHDANKKQKNIMTVLVTGASGFVGSAVARLLLDQGYEVRLLLRPSSDRRNIEGLDAEVVVGDLMDQATLPAAVRGCEGLFHVAADYRLWTRRPDLMFKANVDGSRNIVMAAAEAGVKRIVYTSSVAVLGIPKDGSPGDEQTPVAYQDMIGPYKQSKFKAEEAIQNLADEHDVPVLIVNPSTPIGPRDIKPTPTGRMIVEAASGRMPAYVDTGLNVAHVDDIAAGHLAAYEKGKIGQRYLLGGENLELAQILNEIASIAGGRPPLFCLPHNLIMPLAFLAEMWARLTGQDAEPFITMDGIRMARKKMFFSCEKAKLEISYHHRPAREAIFDAVVWFKENGYCD